LNSLASISTYSFESRSRRRSNSELLAWIAIPDSPTTRDRVRAFVDTTVTALQLPPSTRIVRHE